MGSRSADSGATQPARGSAASAHRDDHGHDDRRPHDPRGPTTLSRYLVARSAAPAIHPGLDEDCPEPSGMGDSRFALAAQIGEGGMGVVRLGVDRDLRRAVAIKVLREEHRDDPLLVRAFVEEAIITGGLEHPNIVPIHEVGYSPEIGPYYAMKRLDGEPLSDLLSRLRQGDEPGSSPARLGRYLEFFAQTLRAIAYAHDRGVIHCDLKPANILVGRYGDVTVVDWGLAKVMGPGGSAQARARLWSGSPGYMAPEQAIEQEADSLDPRTDIWSLGAILYELLTLALPFADDDGQLPEGLHWREIPPPSARAGDRFVPPELERLCLRMLARDPAERPARVKDVLASVEAWLDGSRERERRQAAASHALTEASEALRVARDIEERIDRAASGPSANDPSAPDPTPNDLGADRAELLAVYEGARDAILAGLALNPVGAALEKAAAALYWYTFERIHPGRLVTSREPRLRHRALALLDSLARVALEPIIQRGVAKGVDPAAALPDLVARIEGAADPWLSAAARIAARWGSPPNVARLLARVVALREAPIFVNTAAHELLAVADACEQISLAPGALLFDAGAPGDALYVVLDGVIDIVRGDRVITSVTAPSCFGEIALIDGSPRSAGARARTAAAMLVLTAERFREIMVADGAIGLQVMRVIARRLREATEREVAAPAPPRVTSDAVVPDPLT